MFARFKGALVIDDMIAQVGDMLVGEDIVVCTLTFHDAIELFDIGDTGIYPVFAPVCRVGFEFCVELLSYGDVFLLQLLVSFAYFRQIFRTFFVLEIRLSRFVASFLIEVIEYPSQLG